MTGAPAPTKRRRRRTPPGQQPTTPPRRRSGGGVASLALFIALLIAGSQLAPLIPGYVEDHAHRAQTWIVEKFQDATR